MSPLFLGLALAAAPAAPALKDPPPGPADLVGEWECVSSWTGGCPDGDPCAVRFVFRADGRWNAIRGDQRWEEGKTGYRLDPAADPPAIDLRYDAAAGEGGGYLGIYKLRGDTLTICSGNPGRPRPTAFESPEMSATSLVVLRRVKPKAR